MSKAKAAGAGRLSHVDSRGRVTMVDVGGKPVTTREAGLAEMLRIIKEIEPPKPSTKLSLSGTLPSIENRRGL